MLGLKAWSIRPSGLIKKGKEARALIVERALIKIENVL